MKIALVKRRYSLRHGGSERYCVMLARRLMQLGHDVTVIGERIDEELAGEVRFLPVRVNRLTSWTSNRSFAERAGESARQGRFDIVYGLGRARGLDAVRVTERLQSHWLRVYYPHPLWQQVQKWNPRHRALIDLERTIYNSPQTRRVVTQSRLDRELVVRYYGIPEEKIRTIYNGIDTQVFHPGVRSFREEVRRELGVGDEPLFVFASMDFEGKGLRSILSALSRVKSQGVRLLVLGTGPIGRFQRLAKEAGLGSQVIFAGRRSSIERYYGAGDLFVLPTAYEPFPNVNLEAMACGLPVLTTSTSGGADIIEEMRNGYLISGVHAVEEMAAWFQHHLELSGAARKAMSDACWNTARQMTIEQNVSRTVDVFEDVLREKVCA